MSSLYNTPCSKHKLVVSICSNIETSLAMSTLAVWCRVVQSRDFSAPEDVSTLFSMSHRYSAERHSTTHRFRQQTAM